VLSRRQEMKFKVLCNELDYSQIYSPSCKGKGDPRSGHESPEGV